MRQTISGLNHFIRTAATLWLVCVATIGFAQKAPRHEVFEPRGPDFAPAEGDRAPMEIEEPNLFLNAKVSESRTHWAEQAPELTVNGVRDKADDHWAGLELPNALTIDMGGAREINTIRLWTYWPGGRVYKYLIEGSKDGQNWETLADRRENSERSTPAGDAFAFDTRTLRYVRATMTGNSSGNQSGGHICEIEGYRLEKPLSATTWRTLASGLHGAFGSIDRRYARGRLPYLPKPTKEWSGVAWRGERVGAQIVLFAKNDIGQVRLSATPLRNGKGKDLGESSVQPRFVRYVLGQGTLYPDVIDPVERLDLPGGSARPVWVTLDVPRKAKPGIYTAQVLARAEGGETLTFDLSIEVLDIALPEPKRRAFYLDLWQNPYAIARWHGVEPWSETHFALMAPYYHMLAEAGQKALTVSLLHQPWGAQTHDPFGTMVKWVRQPDGGWEYDFSIFDAYVEFAERVGLTERINCYSMAPWSDRFRYIDGATGDYMTLQAKPGSEAYNDHWRPFLKAFEAHARKKGLLGRVAIAMDERPDAIMRKIVDLVNETAPRLMIASATNRAPQFSHSIHDWSSAIAHPIALDTVRARAANPKLETTFYVCCGPGRPNTFTHSPPAESAWLPLHSASRGLSGFLRWAYCSWVDDPFGETKYSGKNWPAGDCFLVYPGPRSSIRFERLREGIEEYEKIRVLRQKAAASKSPEVKRAFEALEQTLAEFTFAKVKKQPAETDVNAAKERIEALSRALSGRSRRFF